MFHWFCSKWRFFDRFVFQSFMTITILLHFIKICKVVHDESFVWRVPVSQDGPQLSAQTRLHQHVQIFTVFKGAVQPEHKEQQQLIFLTVTLCLCQFLKSPRTWMFFLARLQPVLLFTRLRLEARNRKKKSDSRILFCKSRLFSHCKFSTKFIYQRAWI